MLWSIKQLDCLGIGANSINPLLVPERQKYNWGTVCSSGCKPCQCWLVLDQLYGDLLSSFSTVALGCSCLYQFPKSPALLLWLQRAQWDTWEAWKEEKCPHQRSPHSRAFLQNLCRGAKSTIELDWLRFYRFFHFGTRGFLYECFLTLLCFVCFCPQWGCSNQYWSWCFHIAFPCDGKAGI